MIHNRNAVSRQSDFHVAMKNNFLLGRELNPLARYSTKHLHLEPFTGFPNLSAPVTGLSYWKCLGHIIPLHNVHCNFNV